MKLILTVILPVLISLFVVAIFDAGVPLRLPIGVVLQDESALTRKILRSFESNPVTDIERICSSSSECESAMRRGELLGVVQIPPDLEKRVLRREAPVIPVYISGQSLVAYNMLYKEIQTVLGTLSAYTDIRNLKDPINLKIHAVHNPVMDYRLFLGLGLLAAVYHIAAMVSAVYLKAAKQRLFPSAIILWLLALSFNVWIRYRADSSLAPQDFALLAVGMFGMIAACMAASAAFVAITKSMRIATSVAGVVGGPAFAFSGITFPIAAMPFVVQIYANLLPLTHFLKMQNQIMFGAVGRSAAITPIVILLIMVLFWAVAEKCFLKLRS